MAKPSFPEVFNLADYFLHDRLSEGFGDKQAIRYGAMSYTYSDVSERTSALARYFQSIGVPREHRVYIVLPDTPPFAWSIFATFERGAVVAMGNPASPPDDLAYVVGYSRAAVVITLPDVAASIADALSANDDLCAVLLVPDTATGEDPEGPVEVPEALRDAPFEVAALTDAIAAGRELHTPAPVTMRDDVCMWLFTSGSTGRPKAAIHTHRDFAFNTEVYAKATVGYEHDDVTVSVPRLYFGYATGTNLFFPFAMGATTALFSERPTAEAMAAAIKRDRPTVVTNVPTMLGKLVDYSEDIDMSCVRFHLSAGEALPPTLLDRFQQRFGNDVYDGIGSAEMFHIYASNRPGDIKPGALGKVVDGYELKILPRDATGPGAEPVPAGDIGVMWVKGDSVAMGYFGDRDKSWATFHGHWCRTGDLFRMDADGYVWFAGRADDLFKVGGIWVSPLEVEECLISHPKVSLAAVIPVKREGLDKPKAFVVVAEAARGDTDGLEVELQHYCKDKLSKHKYPRIVELVDDLPKNDRGKVDRKALKQREAQ